jgi:hypothetical protein
MLIRFGFLPLLFVALIIPKWRDFLFIIPWVAITLTLAFLHSRFSFDAGMALAAFAGMAFDQVKPAVLAIALAPILPAYIPMPFLEGFNFYLRPNALRDYGMQPICEKLRVAPPGAVLAPWSFGHWIVWIAKKPVVIGPMLSVGQSEFADGLRFFFLSNPAEAQRFITTHGVRYVIVAPETDSIAARARIAGVDTRAYWRSIAARLTFDGPVAGFREIMRSPYVRVYEISTSPRRD